MRVGLYLRISDDIEGHGLGVKRQEIDGRALAKRRGWQVADTYCDNDISAYKRVVRPEFERLLIDLETGLDGVVVYDLDRFARRPSDLERAIELYDQRALVFATVQSDIDLGTPDGRTMARVLVAFANKASMDTSRRVKRKHLELAQRGVPVGGHRPFGYKADKITIEPREAKLIRQAAEDVLNGVAVNAICKRWNEAGVKTTAGNLWQRSVLRHMLLSPRMAGYRVYQGGIAKDDQGQPVTGLYKPILDVETWEAVCAVLTANKSKRVHVGGRKYLLSGIVRCASCGATMFGGAHPWGFMYHCQNVDCPKPVGVTGRHVDGMITKLVKAYLSERKIKPESVWSGEAELADVTARIAELMNAYGNRELSSEVVFPQVAKLEDQAARLREDKAVWLRERPVPVSVSGAWPNDVDRQRAVIASVILAVVVKPAMKLGNRFDPERVEPPVWKAALTLAPKPRQ